MNDQKFPGQINKDQKQNGWRSSWDIKSRESESFTFTRILTTEVKTENLPAEEFVDEKSCNAF